MENDDEDAVREQCRIGFDAIAPFVPLPDESQYKTVAEKAAALRAIPAEAWYRELAWRYYNDQIGVIVNMYDAWLYWFWKEDGTKLEKKLCCKKVSRLEFNEWLAEDACYRALALRSNYDDAWALLLCVLYQAYTEVNAAWGVATELKDLGQIESGVLRNLERARLLNEKCHTLAYAGGRRLLYRALELAMGRKETIGRRLYYAWANPDVAEKVLEALRDMGRYYNEDLPASAAPAPAPGGVPGVPGAEGAPGEGATPTPAQPTTQAQAASIIEALSYPDKRVRYAAAEALVYMDPRRSFLDSQKVIMALREALRERAFRVILLVFDPHPDGTGPHGKPMGRNLTGIMNALRERIEHSIGLVVLENTGTSGINRAKMYPPFDAVVVCTELRDMKAFEVIDALKGEAEFTKNVPMVVVTPPEDVSDARRLYTGGGGAERRARRLVQRLQQRQSHLLVGPLAQRPLDLPPVRLRKRAGNGEYAQKTPAALEVVQRQSRFERDAFGVQQPAGVGGIELQIECSADAVDLVAQPPRRHP